MICRRTSKNPYYCAIIVVAITVVATVSVSAAKNYLFFPNTYEALANALEPKLDLGTKFDVKDLLDGGKPEFTASDIEDANLVLMIFR